jgi:hypothetical protein
MVTLTAVPPERKPRAFRLRKASELEPTAPSWLIRSYLERDVLALVFADPGAGKSFLAVGWSCCLATGTEWLGHRVTPAPVVYIAGEGQNGIARRLRAWSIRHQIALSDAPLYVSDTAAAMTDPEALAEVIDAIDEIEAPGLIVLDTVARNFGAGDENSTQDMTAFIAAADAIRARYRCAVLLVHHTGHGDKSRARGAMALKGALDAEYRLDRDETGVIRLEATKMKDAPHPEPIAFRLHTVELGIFDEGGAPVTSAVLDPTSYEPPPARGKAGRGKWQTVAKEALTDLHARYRAAKEAGGYDPDTARVPVDDWRIECTERGMPRQTFYDVRDRLQELREVAIENGFAS